MQLLEQLGYSKNATVGSIISITEECATIQGYMECMSEICGSEILFEGVGDIFGKICDIAITIFEKFKKILIKAARTLKNMASKFKRKPRENSQNSENDITDNTLAKNPYTGPRPQGIKDAVDTIIDIGSDIIENITEVLSDHRTIMYMIADGDVDLVTKYAEKILFKLDDKEKMYKVLRNLDYDFESIVNNPNDISNAFEIVYTDIVKHNFCNNEILNFDDVNENFKNTLNTVRYGDLLDIVGDGCETLSLDIDKCIQVAKNLSTKNDFDDPEFKLTAEKYIKQITHDTSILSSICTSIMSSAPKISQMACEDINTVLNNIERIRLKCNI